MYEIKKFIKAKDILINTLLDPKDIPSLATLHNIPSFLRIPNTPAYTTEHILQFIISLSIIIYQYLYCSWTMIYTMTNSGIRRILNIISTDPLYLGIFVLSFYFVYLGDDNDVNKQRFNTAMSVFNFPTHQNFTSNIYIKVFTEKFLMRLKLPLTHAPFIIKLITIAINKTGELSINGLLQFISTMNSSMLQSRSSNIAIAMHLTEFDPSSIEEYKLSLTNTCNISQNKKKKRQTKSLLKSQTEIKTSTNQTVCLENCAPRIKANNGCFCEDNCGKNLTDYILGRRAWCHTSHCDRGDWSYCKTTNPKHLKCFTGLEYMDCINNKINNKL